MYSLGAESRPVSPQTSATRLGLNVERLLLTLQLELQRGAGAGCCCGCLLLGPVKRSAGCAAQDVFLGGVE